MKKIILIGIILIITSCSKETISKDNNLGVYNAMALIKGFQYHNSKISIYKIGDKYAMGFDIPDYNVRRSEMINYDGQTFTLETFLFGAKSTKGKVLNSNTVEITIEYDASQSSSGQAYTDYIIASK
jgi:hypothetical protein